VTTGHESHEVMEFRKAIFRAWKVMEKSLKMILCWENQWRRRVQKWRLLSSWIRNCRNSRTPN